MAPTFARDFGPLTGNGLQVNGERLDVTVTGPVQVTAPGELAVTAT
ncbi:hypothetical protein [Streptomyces variegatus]